MLRSEHTPSVVRHNAIVNLLDGSFFGFGLYLSSFGALIPLFASHLTDSTMLIGFIIAAHTVGWQLPQLFTAGMVAQRRRYLPLVLLMTLQERIAYFGLAIAALLILVNPTLALVLTVIFTWWHGLGGGFTAVAWQSMMNKIMPPHIRGTFYGMQSAGANLFGSVGTLVAGGLLAALPYPLNYAACFTFTAVSMLISFGFLALTKEEPHEAPKMKRAASGALGRNMRRIWQTDYNFRYFILARVLSQFAQMAVALYSLYAARVYGISAAEIAGMIGIMTITQTLANPLVGRFGDVIGHRWMFMMTNAVLLLSVGAAWSAASTQWFYLVFALVGVVNSQWTVILAISGQFGTIAERPYYIGMLNTLIAPVTLLAPTIGGALVDGFGFPITFALSGVCAIGSIFVMLFFVYEPQPDQEPVSEVLVTTPVGD